MIESYNGNEWFVLWIIDINLQDDYQFKFSQIEQAIKDLIKKAEK